MHFISTCKRAVILVAVHSIRNPCNLEVVSDNVRRHRMPHFQDPGADRLFVCHLIFPPQFTSHQVRGVRPLLKYTIRYFWRMCTGLCEHFVSPYRKILPSSTVLAEYWELPSFVNQQLKSLGTTAIFTAIRISFMTPNPTMNTWRSSDRSSGQVRGCLDYNCINTRIIH